MKNLQTDEMTNWKSNLDKLKIYIKKYLYQNIILEFNEWGRHITIPVHEAAHWIMSDIDPYVEPVEFHLFDDNPFQNGQNILSSALGYVLIKEAYPGAFNDRPIWANLLQELICVSLQIILTCIIVSKILTIIIDKKLKLHKISKPNF
jgi:hypothetical protein